MWDFLGSNWTNLLLLLAVLACPLMHAFGHRHGGHRAGERRGDRT